MMNNFQGRRYFRAVWATARGDPTAQVMLTDRLLSPPAHPSTAPGISHGSQQTSRAEPDMGSAQERRSGEKQPDVVVPNTLLKGYWVGNGENQQHLQKREFQAVSVSRTERNPQRTHRLCSYLEMPVK